MTAAQPPKTPTSGRGERTREGTVKRPPNSAQEAGDEAIIPDQTAEAGPEPLDQSNESDQSQKSLRGSGPPS